MTDIEKNDFALKMISINIKWVAETLLNIILENNLDIDEVKSTLGLWKNGNFDVEQKIK
jgi:hypothetical protein